MFRLLIICCLFCFACAAQQKPAIQLNQVGFYPSAPKIAIVTGNVSANNFCVVSGKDTVFRGALRSSVADFTSFKRIGRYVVVVPGAASSYPFEIKNNVHHDVAVAALKGYYFMRSDIPLLPQYAGKWHRPAGHPDTAVLIYGTQTKISTPGGWYDAGDYNKYIVNSGITMETLLSAYEDFAPYFDKLKTNVPESGDAIPDILNEIIYNLRWMLTMQDASDGGVYHKCTNAAFDGMVMPGVTKLPRYIVQKSTAAALDFAAVTAQAARILKKFDKKLSDSCINASVRAWQWSLKNPAVLFRNPSGVSTGEYGDNRVSDEWLWAAAELFVTTGDRSYYREMREPVSVPSWNNVGMLAYYTLARSGDQQAKDSILALANKLTSVQNAFHTIMGQSRADYIWGSNAVAANQGMLLIKAYRIDANKKYLDGALSNLDYVLGRNATGYCFVTGIGTKSPLHPHHRPSEADGITEPVPGLLAGGPNYGRQDKCNYPFTEPETAYVDDVCSYASNEIAINWNAPLVYLAGAIEALMKNTR